jgi:NAD(P)-dependent dehydrogenase (short-subunit alcohol dehydrogenase family)
MAVNAKGTWLCLKHEIPLMLENGGGAIVNCSSVASLIGVASHYGYTASKCAVDGLTRVAAMEFAAANIRVNAVCPGVVETEMVSALLDSSREMFTAFHPIGRLGKPNDIARAVVWLCSEEASFITGQVLPVDGGWTVH